jgi:hypothetical protein
MSKISFEEPLALSNQLYAVSRVKVHMKNLINHIENLLSEDARSDPSAYVYLFEDIFIYLKEWNNILLKHINLFRESYTDVYSVFLKETQAENEFAMAMTHFFKNGDVL